MRRDAALLASQAIDERLRVRERDHPIQLTVDDLDAAAPDLIGNLLQLLQRGGVLAYDQVEVVGTKRKRICGNTHRGRFVVPPCGHSLAHEPLAGETGRVVAFVDFTGGDAVAIGGVRLDGVLKAVWKLQPFVGVEILLGSLDLVIYGAGNAALISSRSA